MVKASLVVILLGVGLSTVSDVELNLRGSVFALLGIVATALAQLLRIPSTSFFNVYGLTLAIF
jgi:hypothetical protein